jgi:hypothetical protein
MIEVGRISRFSKICKFGKRLVSGEELGERLVKMLGEWTGERLR